MPADTNREEKEKVWFREGRHVEEVQGASLETLKHKDDWRKIRERMKTVSVALVLCLNIGTDPPDVQKPHPCARKQAWVDPSEPSTKQHFFKHQNREKMKVQCVLCFFILSELFVVPAVVHAKPVKGKKLVEKRATGAMPMPMIVMPAVLAASTAIAGSSMAASSMLTMTAAKRRQHDYGILSSAGGTKK
uniref:Raptor_N domain-containing protein n=1 Tax=Globodera pallida TaxID=36090 RepID=A0A183CCG9_GLOPA